MPDFAALRDNLLALVQRGVARAVMRYGEPDNDPFRGLHISPEEFCRLLSTSVDTMRLGIQRGVDDGPPSLRLDWLCRRYNLTAFDRDVLLVAAGPDIDLRYERIYAYLNDDVGRRHATIDLVLELLCETTVEKHIGRSRLSPEMPLLANQLIRITDGSDVGFAAADARIVRVDEQVLAWLTGVGGLDTRLAKIARCATPRRSIDADMPPAIRATFNATLAQIAEAKTWSPLLLLMEGEDPDTQANAAEAFAAAGGLRVLRVALDALSGDGVAELLAREAFFKDALLSVDAHGAPTEAVAAKLRTLSAALETSPCVVALACRQSTGVLGDFHHPVVPLRFGAEDIDVRCVRWRAALAAHDASADAKAIERVAQRIALPSRGIAAAAATAVWAARAEMANGRVKVSATDLQDAARRFARRDLSALAQTIVPVATWDQLVSSADAVAQLREFCARVDCNNRLLDQWGLGRRISYGTGISALFFGPSGTGKTMAAEIIAGELGLDLLKIDLSGVVSKYIGETEKNLEKIFVAARGTPSILFFDEADALFGKRSEVRDSHDRYANVEISYLLQRMEAFEGVTILATNIHQNLDEAFVRRLTFAVHFPFPDAEQRRAIWRGIFPPEVPLDADVDLGVLARRFPICGGAIKNAALAAAALATSERTRLGMRHLLHAVRREYQKMGKSLTPAELLGTVEAARTAGE